MIALITNDDGIGSSGLSALALAATEAGFEVVVAAPSWDSSGASASLTSVEHEGRVLVDETALEGIDGQCLSIEAAPAFIVRAALHGSFGPRPDIVLSGINRGLNCGNSILHSGTVGAATTAFTYGTPAIAFSIDAGRTMRWDTAKSIAKAVLHWFGEAEPMILLNVNVPNVGTVAGLRLASLAAFGAVTANVTEIGKGYVSLEYRANDARPEPGSDFALIAEGFATYTPLVPVCQASDDSTAADTTAALADVTMPQAHPERTDRRRPGR
jgi:5'-nucleotidase